MNVFLIFTIFFQVCRGYVTTFGGKVYGGPNNNYPINACFTFHRPDRFEQCEGDLAANAYCQSRGYTSAVGFSKALLKDVGASFIIGNGQIVEAGLPADQHLLNDVVCV